MIFKHLLFPVLSPSEGKEELKGVAKLASNLAASLTLLRVVDPFREGGPRPTRQEAASLGANSCGLDVGRIHVQSHPDAAASIADFAAREKVDGIVFPRSRRRWVPAFFRRQEMLRRLSGQTDCPLWFMDDEEQRDRPIRRVLCAVSGRDNKVLETAATISERMGARLFVLHVVPEIHEGLLAYGFDDHIALSAENGMKLLAALQRRCGTEGQPIVEIGDRERCITRAARTLRADLVITGRRKNTKARRWSFNAAGSALAPRVPCQSLVV